MSICFEFSIFWIVNFGYWGSFAFVDDVDINVVDGVDADGANDDVISVVSVIGGGGLNVHKSTYECAVGKPISCHAREVRRWSYEKISGSCSDDGRSAHDKYKRSICNSKKE